MQALSLILLSVLINTTAQLLLKAGVARINNFNYSWATLGTLLSQILTNPFIVGGLACYVVAVAVWLLVLSRIDVGVAYPMVSLGYITTAIAAYYLFGEHLSPVRILGIAVILLGVYLVARP